MMKIIATVLYMFSIPWGIVQCAAGRGWDWLVLAFSGLIFWDACFMEKKKNENR